MKPVPHVGVLAPYALADLPPELTSLAQNESFRPPSPKAVEAARGALSDAHLYPDPDWTALRSVIAAVHGVPEQAVLCGAGSMELIGALAASYLGSTDRMLTTEYAYLYFRTATQLSGAAFDLVGERDLTVDVDALIAAARPETKIVFVANPGNPTGTRIDRDALVRLRDGLAEDVLLVIDEAYGEFSDGAEASTFDLVERGNTMVLRTLSKAYGCAGLRVGWGVFPTAIATELRKVLNPNNVSGVSQSVAAAVMSDQAYMCETVSMTADLRDRFATRLRGVGLKVPVSATNFVLIVFSTDQAAAEADQALRGEGIGMRGMGGYGLPHCLRATIGDAATMDRAAACLERIVGVGR